VPDLGKIFKKVRVSSGRGGTTAGSRIKGRLIVNNDGIRERQKIIYASIFEANISAN
jgi:hypothetical protein